MRRNSKTCGRLYGDDQVWSVSGILTFFEAGAKLGQLTKG